MSTLKPWNELEKTRWTGIDVASTTSEAMQSTDPNKLYLTKDHSVVMNRNILGKTYGGVTNKNYLGLLSKKNTIN